MSQKMENIYSRRVRWWLLLIQLVLLYIPSFQFFSLQTDNGTIPASACYFFSVIFVPWLIMNLRNIRLPHWSILGLFLLVYVVAAIRLPQYGLSKSILHWVFGLYLIITVINVGADFSKEMWLKLLETGACVFLTMHIAFLLINSETVAWLIHGYYTGELEGTYAAKLPSLTRGGRNLDATWLALGGFFVTGKKKTWYITYCILFAFLGSSRVGLIASALLVIWTLIYDRQYCLTKKRIKWYVLYIALMTALLLWSGLAEAGLGRFSALLPHRAATETVQIEVIPESDKNQTSEGDETKETVTIPSKETNERVVEFLSGRAAMWSRFPRMFWDNPFGYGVGNALRVMRLNYGFTGYEDVMHNVFLQLTLDEGFVGGIWFGGLVICFLYGQRRERFRSPYAGYFLTYLILAMVQFHGGEALMQFTLAVFLAERNGWFFVPWSKKQNRESGEAKNGAFKNIADHPRMSAE